jgi:hypothetical protein
VPLSCEYIFYQAQRRAKRKPTEGATLAAILEALKDDGQPHETGWAYLAQLPTDLTQWQPPAGIAPLFRRTGETGKDTVDAIVDELAQGRPVLALLRLSRSFDWVGADGIIDQAVGEQPENLRRHAVIAVGHGEIGGQPAILIRNSWGTAWGDGGYGWLTERFLLPRVFRVAILKEDVSVSPSTVTA